jgi:RNase adaptor protein for sRNA GlmZ degradation
MIASFGKDTDHPRTQYTFDVTHWRDPIGQKSMRHLNGKHSLVRGFVKEDPRFDSVRAMVLTTVQDLLNNNRCTYLSIGFKDHAGTHIAPALAEEIADVLAEKYQVQVEHYGLSKRSK